MIARTLAPLAFVGGALFFAACNHLDVPAVEPTLGGGGTGDGSGGADETGPPDEPSCAPAVGPDDPALFQCVGQGQGGFARLECKKLSCDRAASVALAGREVRAGGARQMKSDGHEPVLKHSRWCLLKRPENLTDKQRTKLSDLVRYNLRTVKAYLLKEGLYNNCGTFQAMGSRTATRGTYGRPEERSVGVGGDESSLRSWSRRRLAR